MNKSYKKVTEIFRLSALILFTVFAIAGQDEEDFISPVRSTVSEGASVQKAGVLQVEYGGDFDFDTPDFRNQQSAPLGVYFAVWRKAERCAEGFD